MTTEERLENVERDLARAKRRNRSLLTALGLGLGALVQVVTRALNQLPRQEA